MTNIIVLFPKAKDAGNVRSLLVRHGFLVSSVCTTGAQALAQANVLGDGILVCGYKYPDMIYSELRTALPSHFEMILVASQRVLSECGDPDLICITLPIKVRDLLNTIDLMAEQIARRKKRLRQKPKIRSEEEKRILLEAISLLMERNQIGRASCRERVSS